MSDIYTHQGPPLIVCHVVVGGLVQLVYNCYNQMIPYSSLISLLLHVTVCYLQLLRMFNADIAVCLCKAEIRSTTCDWQCIQTLCMYYNGEQ